MTRALPNIFRKCSKITEECRRLPKTAVSCGIENFESIVSERVQVNLDNSRVMSALTFLLFKLNTLQKNTRQSSSQPKPWCNDSGVVFTTRLLHHDNDIREVAVSQLSITWYKLANQKIAIPTEYES